MTNLIKNIALICPENKTEDQIKNYYVNLEIDNKNYEYYELANILRDCNIANNKYQISSSTYNRIKKIIERWKELNNNFLNINNISEDLILYFLCCNPPSSYSLFFPKTGWRNYLQEQGLSSIALTDINNNTTDFLYGTIKNSYLNNLTHKNVEIEVNILAFYFKISNILYVGYENNYLDDIDIFSEDSLFPKYDFNKLKILFEYDNTKKIFNTGLVNQSFYSSHDSFKTLIGSNLINFNQNDVSKYYLKYCSGNIKLDVTSANIGISQDSKLWFIAKPTSFLKKYNILSEINNFLLNQKTTSKNFFHDINILTNQKDIVLCSLNYQDLYSNKKRPKVADNLINFLLDVKSIELKKSHINIDSYTNNISADIYINNGIKIKNASTSLEFLLPTTIEKYLPEYLIYFDKNYNKIDSKGYFYTTKRSILPMYNKICINASNTIMEKPKNSNPIIRYYDGINIICDNNTRNKFSTANLVLDNTFNNFILYLDKEYKNRKYHLLCFDTDPTSNWLGKKPNSIVEAKEIADFLLIEEIDKENPLFLNKYINTNFIGKRVFYISFIHCKGDKYKHGSPNSLNIVLGQIFNSIIYTDLKDPSRLINQLKEFIIRFQIDKVHPNLINEVNKLFEPDNQIIFEISICYPNYDTSINNKYSKQLNDFLHHCQNTLSANNIYFTFFY